jgi:hypothetical protein
MPLGRLVMSMLVLAVGLNAPSLPLLPLFTWAWPRAGSQTASKAAQNTSGRDAFHRVPDLFPKKWDAVERVLT